MSYIIPKGEITLTDMKKFRHDAEDAAIDRAVDLKVAPSREQLSVRGFENVLDAGTATEQWNTAPLLLINTPYSIFTLAVPAPTLPANRLAVFYKVGIETVPVPVSLLTFRTGGFVGNIIAEFDLEQIINSLEMEGFFSQPVVIDPQTLFSIQVTSRIATLVFARVQLGGLIVEPVGQRIAGGT